MKKYLLLIISLVLHLVAIALIIYLVWPIAKWYLDQVPARGIDLYLSASYVVHLLRDFAFRFNGWKEIWFSGVPYFKDYPSLYFYLMLPFAKAFGVIRGIQMFAVVFLFVFAGFSYLLYYELSRSRVLAMILSLATVYSANLYRALIWAGGIPFWTTQALFPIILLLVAKYCRSQNQRWLLASAVVTGLGIMGHPQNFVNIIIPSVITILLFWQPGEDTGKKLTLVARKRVINLVKFGLVSYLVALPVISQFWNFSSSIAFFISTITKPFAQKQLPQSTGGTPMIETTVNEVEAWTRAQFTSVWTDTNRLIFYLAAICVGVFFLSLLLRKRRGRGILFSLPFLFLAGWTIGSVFLYSRGIDLYITGWYKAYWPVLVGVASLAAFCWGEAKETFAEREFWQNKAIKVIRWIGVVVVNLALLATGWYFLEPSKEILFKELEKHDNFSSAYPEILNVRTGKQDLAAFKEQLKPKFMTDDPHDYRLYVIDATVNIAWGAVEDVPLTRGYVDPPLSTEERWGLFWLDSALGPTDTGPKSSLIEDWNTPEKVADNNVKFLLDWYGTKYLEGNHVSASNSNFASNIMGDKFIEAEEKVETMGSVKNRYLEDEYWSDEGKQQLNFYKIKEELVSPILMATDTPAILHVGADDGYDSLVRFLGEVNLGPRKIVLARGPKFIDQLSFTDLSNFQAIILYKYDYRNYDKAWSLMGKFIEKGGRVFVDTGPEGKESGITTPPLGGEIRKETELPGVFPFKKLVREDLGQQWEPEAADNPINNGVDFNQFSPLVFDSGVWNVSHPVNADDLRDDSTVILRHKGIPVVAERTMGQGKVIWSGFNLPYHAIRDYNPQEARFFKNILGELVELKENPVLSKGKFISARERVIEIKEARGVIFKEQGFDGWKATFNGRGLKIYKTGPSSPGFMYVSLPEGATGEVRFKYVGPLSTKLQTLVSLLVVLLVLDYILGGKLLIAMFARLSRPVKGHLHLWWGKEDDY